MAITTEEIIADKVEQIYRLMASVHSLKAARPECRLGYQFSPGGILNAYREGDLSFDEAVRELKRWRVA